MDPLEMFFWLLVGHCLADFPLQGTFLSVAKDHTKQGTTSTGKPYPWQLALAPHALIHGGAVALVTGSVPLGVAETLVHALIDYHTCAGRTGGYWGDQMLHVACKLFWLTLIMV